MRPAHERVGPADGLNCTRDVSAGAEAARRGGAPGGTKGSVVLPGREGGGVRTLSVDGKERTVKAQEVGSDGRVRFEVEGGEHSLVVGF